MLNLRRIECFLAVVDAGTVTSAAVQLNIAQPALSRQLHTLEAELGVRLFENRRNRLVLSAAGRDLLPFARQVMESMRLVIRAAEDMSAQKVRSLTVSAAPATITSLIAPFIASSGSVIPLLFTKEGLPDHLYETLYHASDMIVSPGRLQSGYAHLMLGRAPLRAFVNGSHRWALEKRVDVSLRELTQETLLIHTMNFYARQMLDSAMIEAGLAYGEYHECDQAATIQALASVGHGVGVLTDLPAYPGWHVKIRNDRNTDHPYISAQLHAAWSPNHHCAKLIEEIATGIKEFFHLRQESPNTFP